MSDRPRVAITMGDAAGIGPEITVKSLADPRATQWCIPLVLGDARVIEKAMDATGMRLPVRRIADPAEARGDAGTVEIIDYANVDMAAHQWGVVNPGFGDAAVRWTKDAGQLCLRGAIDAMVS